MFNSLVVIFWPFIHRSIGMSPGREGHAAGKYFTVAVYKDFPWHIFRGFGLICSDHKKYNCLNINWSVTFHFVVVIIVVVIVIIVYSYPLKSQPRNTAEQKVMPKH